MPSFSVVKLEKSGQILVVNSSWCSGLRSAKAKKRGNRLKLLQKIFVSSNTREVANFILPVRDILDMKKNACYRGTILKCFGTYLCISI